jgi:hypothetical protein
VKGKQASTEGKAMRQAKCGSRGTRIYIADTK